MADEMLSEVITEQTNPVGTDRIYLINYTGVADPDTGSLWQSLYITLTGIYNYILSLGKSTGNFQTITSHTFNIIDVSYDYTAARYEMIEDVIIKGLPTGKTVEILGFVYDSVTGLYNGVNLIDPETGQPEVFPLKHYCSSNVTFERIITIIPSASCTIIIKSTKGL